MTRPLIPWIRLVPCGFVLFDFFWISLLADIAEISIDQARERYTTLRAPKFAAYFAAADCYNEPLSVSLPPGMYQTVFPPTGQPFDVVSMQFCMHYAFESETKARMMLANVSSNMRQGGVFIGTIPNSAQLL